MNVAKLEGEKYNVMVNCLNPGAATRMTVSVRLDGRPKPRSGDEPPTWSRRR